MSEENNMANIDSTEGFSRDTDLLVQQKVKAFNEKQIEWMELAALLHQVRRNYRSAKALSIIAGLTTEYTGALIDSYRFLEVQGYLNREIKGAPTTIWLLPMAKQKLTEKGRESEYPLLVQDVLEGKCSKLDLYKQIEGPSHSITTEDIYGAIKKTMSVLNYMIDKALQEDPESLRNQTGRECHEMAMRLENIYDPGFNERKTFKL